MSGRGADPGQRQWSGLALLGIGSLLWAAWAGSAQAQQGPGYRISGERIAIDSPAHWRQWTLPTHAVEVRADGRVIPRLFRGRYNLLDDRETFRRRLKELKRSPEQSGILNLDSTETLDIRGNVLTEKKGGREVPIFTYLMRMGISRVGSNGGLAANILDGDPSTYWEPDPEAPLEDWWIEVDLGRVVVVDSVVVRFVEEPLGDPFRQFRLLAAPDQEPVMEEASKVDFELVGRTTVPNRDRREFSFGLAQPRSSAEWTGRMVETIRIVVTDTKGRQGRQVSEAEWKALDEADRGEVVYFIKALEGFEEPETQEVYESLPPEQQGHKEYYLRERPRLADIEVWGFGENIGLGMVEGGGSVSLTGGGFSPGAGIDGDYSTFFVHTVRERTALIDRGVLTMDLGATFWLDAMRISSTSTSTDGYVVRSSDGTRDTSGRLKWARLSSPVREDNSVDLFEHFLDAYDPAPRLRFLEMITIYFGLRSIYYQGPEITEYQLFTEGYPAEVVLRSPLMEIPPNRRLGGLSWQGETPPGTRLEIRTRSGSLRRKEVRYFDKSGSELTQKQWSNLLGSFKGPVDTAYVVGSDWSLWSRPYGQGEVVQVPSADRYVQVEVRLGTQDRGQAASVGGLAVDLVEPVAERLVGEVWPVAVGAAGEVDTFGVYVQSFLVEEPSSLRSMGFDKVLVKFPGASGLELLEVGIGVEEATGEAARVFRRREGGGLVDEGGVELAAIEGGDSLWVGLPEEVAAVGVGSERTYYRVTGELEQVPVDGQGQVLTAASYGQLPVEERGDRRYYRRVVAAGEVRLVEVDQATFAGLSEGEGAVRYFRVLLDEGGQFAFDARGDSLDGEGYNGLPAAARGRVVGRGPLLRLGLAGAVYVNGATVEVAVRQSGEGTATAASWQGVEAGDATRLVGGDRLSIEVPMGVKPLGEVVVHPNPFTPNGDGVNDQVGIGFSVFKLGAGRPARVGVYSLDGRRVWEHRQEVFSGAVEVRWEGKDASGRQVPPGIYVCRVELEVDAKDAGSTALARLIHVVY